jgi:hypothetical protein
MAQKFVHDVSPELTHEAAYKNFANIESHALTSGSTIRFWPGVYEIGNATFDGITLEGMGAKESVVLCNSNVTLANTVNIRNVTLSGNSPAAASTSAAIFVTNASNAVAKGVFENVNFTNGDFGIDNQGLPALVFNRCDFTGVDRAIQSNSVLSANASFCFFNTTSNSYFKGANTGLKAIQVRASYSGGSNTGNTTKVVTANVA